MRSSTETVATCRSAAEAESLRGHLRSEGIPAVLRDANVLTVDPALSPAAGYIRVDVPAEYEARAREVLRALATRAPVPAGEEADAICAACRRPLPEGDATCGRCGWSYGTGEAAVDPEPDEPEVRDEPGPSPSFPAPIPGRWRLLGWLPILAWGLWLAGLQTFDPLPDSVVPEGDPAFALVDLPLLGLGCFLLVVGGLWVMVQGTRRRVRPRSTFARHSAQALAAGVGLTLAMEVLWYAGVAPAVGPVTWLFLPLWAPALAVAWPLVRRAGARRTRAAFGLVRGAGLRWEIALGIVAFPAALAASFLCDWILGFPESSTHPVYQELADESLVVRACAVLSLVAVAPLAEEVLFRGVVYRFLRDATMHLHPALGVATAATVSSFLFAVGHLLGWGAVPSYLVAGIAAALLREWRGSLVAPTALHAAHNGYLVLLFAFERGL